MEDHVGVLFEMYDFEPSPVTAQFFGNAGREHMKMYGTKPEHFAKIAMKNYRHAVHNQ